MAAKYGEAYREAYANGSEAHRELGAYFRFYNDQRPHQALGYQTPAEVTTWPRMFRGSAERKGDVHRFRCW